MKVWHILFLLPVCGVMAIQPEQAPDYFRGSREQIEVTNWVLAQPNGHPITVLDLAKKMEVVFRQQFPEYADSIQARFQFYNMTWRSALDELINNQLILADAEERKVEISDGEVRRELEEMFGPNVVQTIDDLGLSHDEAWDLVKTDLLVQRMRMGFVMGKALAYSTPERICEEYERIASKAASDEEYRYRVLTIRHKKRAKAELAAQRAFELIQEQGTSDLIAVKEALEAEAETGELFPRIRVSVSDMEQRALSSLAAGHKEALLAMDSGACSEPIPQWSRVENSTVFRIFYLEDHVTPAPPSFADLEEKIKDRLFHEAAAEEYERYVVKLRTRFKMGEETLAQMIPQDFQPFKLH